MILAIHASQKILLTSEGVQKVLVNHVSSFRRKLESSISMAFWTPACAGVADFGGFLETLSGEHKGKIAQMQNCDKESRHLFLQRDAGKK